MHKKIVLFVACLLFGGLQILASGGGGRKELDYSNLMEQWRLEGPSADAMKAILNSSNADDVQGALDTLKNKTTDSDLKNVFAQLLFALTDGGVSAIETSTQADEEIETFGVERQRAAIEKILEYRANPINDPIDTVLFSDNKECDHTLLYRAIQNKVDPSIIEYLLKKGAVIDEQSGTGIKKCEICTCRQCPTPTHLAVYFGCTDILAVLDPQDCLVQNRVGDIPLHLEFKKLPNVLSQKYDVYRAQILLDKMIAATEDKTREAPAELLSRQNNDGKSLLHGAIQQISNWRTAELATRLLNTGVEKHQLDKDGNSPLMLLVKNTKRNGNGDDLFNTFLENAPLEALGSKDELILFQPFVRDNLVRFAKVIQHIKAVMGNSSAESATWMNRQKKDTRTVLQNLVSLDQGSCMLNRFLGGGQDFSRQVRCLFDQGLVHPDDHAGALELAKKYSNEKMKTFLCGDGKSLMAAQQKVWAAEQKRIAAAERARIAEEVQAAADAANAERARAAAEQKRIADAEEAARVAEEARAAEEARVAQAAVEARLKQAAADQRRIAEAIEAANAERARAAAEEAARVAEEARLKFETAKAKFESEFDEREGTAEQRRLSAQKSKLVGRFATVVVTAAIATALTALAVAKNPQAFHAGYKFGKTALSKFNASVTAFATAVANGIPVRKSNALKATA